MATDRHQYCIIFDKNENCHVFFSYKRTMKDVYKEALSINIRRKTLPDALEVLRKGMVYSMRIGDTMCFNLNETVVDFNKEWTHSKELPMDKICNFDLWRKDEVYLQLVKPNENYDLLQNKNMYHMKPEFTICFLALYTTDADMLKVYQSIPHSDQMQVLIVAP